MTAPVACAINTTTNTIYVLDNQAAAAHQQTIWTAPLATGGKATLAFGNTASTGTRVDGFGNSVTVAALTSTNPGFQLINGTNATFPAAINNPLNSGLQAVTAACTFVQAAKCGAFLTNFTATGLGKTSLGSSLGAKFALLNAAGTAIAGNSATAEQNPGNGFLYINANANITEVGLNGVALGNTLPLGFVFDPKNVAEYLQDNEVPVVRVIQ